MAEPKPRESASRIRYVDLHDVLPDARPDFDTSGDRAYWKCEREKLTPALEAAGYIVHGGWQTGDGDSFGPLTRYVTVSKSGDTFRVIYG